MPRSDTTSNATNVVATPQTIATNAITFLRRDARGRGELAVTAESSHIYSPIPDVTDILPGQLAYVFGVSILDAAFLSWVALLWYRRSVRRLMREGGPDAVSPAAEPPQPAVPAHTSPDDQFEELSLTEEPPASSNVRRVTVVRTGQRRVILAYAAGAAAYAAVITMLKFTAEQTPLPAVAWLVEWWTNTWPIVPTLVALLVLDRPAIVRLSLRYVIGGAIAIALFTTVVQLLRGTLDTAPVTNVFWAMVSLVWAAWLPLALLAVTGWRRVRAVHRSCWPRRCCSGSPRFSPASCSFAA